MGTAPNFFFRSAFPFCPITRTTADIDDIVTNGYGTTPGAYTYAGRVDGLTFREAWQLYWMKEKTSLNISVSGDSGGSSPYSISSLTGSFSAIGKIPSFRACKDQARGLFNGTGYIPPSPVDGDSYCSLSGYWLMSTQDDDGFGVSPYVPPVIHNSDDDTYTVLFTVYLILDLNIYYDGHWSIGGQSFISSGRPTSGAGTTGLSLFGGTISLWVSVESGIFPTATITDFTDEGDFTIT